MKLYSNIKTVLILFFAGVVINSCQKMEQPPLGDYPVDANPPGGPLKFYAAMDEKNVDSIRANYGTFNDASIVDGGVSGKAAQFDGTKNGYINYPSANDFASTASDFTISFWLNITAAQKDHEHAVGIMSLANTLDYTNGTYHKDGFWGNFTIFADHETSTSDSMLLKIVFWKAADSSNIWDATSEKWPHMYDGQWHNVVYTYSASTSTYIAYRDGQEFHTLTIPGIKFAFASQLILGGFQQAAGIVGKYSENTWMAGFPGMIDNVRLYGEALSAADVAALYANKE